MRIKTWTGVSSLVVACNPTFAPPVRSVHDGAPGRLTNNQGDVTVALTTEATGGASLSLPVAPNTHIEVSGDVSPYWTMAGMGLRFTHPTMGNGFVRDLELGLGGGVGGTLCGNHAQQPLTLNCDGSGATWDGRSAAQRAATGAYLGGGIGRRWGIFTLFGRARVQGSVATDLPVTFWWSTLGGGELRLGPINVYLALGLAGYYDRMDNAAGALAEGGLAIPFNLD